MANTAKKTATSKKASPAKSTARRRIDKRMRIEKLVKGNPRREASVGYESFSIIKSGMTVEKFQEKGGSLAALRWDLDHGHLKLVK